jgi:hypothetical protein
LRNRRCLTLAFVGDETPAGLGARAEVAQALIQTGHEVIVIPGAHIPLPPDPALFGVSERYRADALILVHLGSGSDPGRISIAGYDLSGARLFGYEGRLLPPVVPLAPTLPQGSGVSSAAEGPELYRALDRPDLARRYERRRATKTVLHIGGGVLLIGGVVAGIVDVLAVAAENRLQTAGCAFGFGSGSCQGSAQASSIPWLVAFAGLWVEMTPAFFSTDPLSRSEKDALLKGSVAPTHPSLSFTVAPAAGGAQLTAGGRF